MKHRLPHDIEWSDADRAVRDHIDTLSATAGARDAWFHAVCAACAENGWGCHANAHPFSGGCVPEMYAHLTTSAAPPLAAEVAPNGAGVALTAPAPLPFDHGREPVCFGCPQQHVAGGERKGATAYYACITPDECPERKEPTCQ